MGDGVEDGIGDGIGDGMGDERSLSVQATPPSYLPWLWRSVMRNWLCCTNGPPCLVATADPSVAGQTRASRRYQEGRAGSLVVRAQPAEPTAEIDGRLWRLSSSVGHEDRLQEAWTGSGRRFMGARAADRATTTRCVFNLFLDRMQLVDGCWLMVAG